MTVQTYAGIQKLAIIEKYGVKIGKEEWDEIQEYYSYWIGKVRETCNYYDGKIPEKYLEEIDMQALFFEGVRNAYNYMYSQQSKMPDFSGSLPEYWVVNPIPASYFISYDGCTFLERTITFQEFMGFLALGVAKKCWTIDDAINHVVSACRANKLLEV